MRDGFLVSLTVRGLQLSFVASGSKLKKDRAPYIIYEATLTSIVRDNIPLSWLKIRLNISSKLMSYLKSLVAWYIVYKFVDALTLQPLKYFRCSICFEYFLKLTLEIYCRIY